MSSLRAALAMFLTTSFVGATVLGAAPAPAPAPRPAAPSALPVPAASACQITNIVPMMFGPYTAGQPHPTDSVGEIDVLCSGSVSLQIELARGVSGHIAPRGMTSLGATLNYNIYQDAACTTIWGDGTGGSQLYALNAVAGQLSRIPMYGRIYPLQSVPHGVYSDQIVATLVL